MEKLRFGIMGYGRMGKLVEQALSERGEVRPEIIRSDERDLKDPRVLRNVVSVICFTSPESGYKTTKRVLSNGADAIVGTTKFYLNEDGSINQEMLEEFLAIAIENRCRMIYSPNFSMGVNAFFKHLDLLAQTLSKLGYDPAIEERHHLLLINNHNF